MIRWSNWVLCLLCLSCAPLPIDVEGMRKAQVRSDLIKASELNYDLGLRAFGANDYANAEKYFYLSVDLWENAPGLDALGTVAFARGDYQVAEKFFNRAIEVDPRFVGAHVNLGIFFVELGHKREALKHFEIAHRLDPKHIRARQNLLTLKADLGLLSPEEVRFEQGVIDILVEEE